MEGFLDFFAQEKAHRVTGTITLGPLHKKSVTTVRSMHKVQLLKISILRWAQNFVELERVVKAQASGRSTTLPDQEKKVISCFFDT